MDQSGKGLHNKVKAIAMETLWVLEVILCWVVALPILLIVFLGLVLWQKIEKMRLTQSRYPSGTDLPLRSSRDIETRPAVNAMLLNELLSEHRKFPEQNRKLHEQEPGGLNEANRM
jgi:hypothetical protein